MYRHILVPVDGTPLSIDAIGQAVVFASEVGAKITFFYADQGFTPFIRSEGIPESTISPQILPKNLLSARKQFSPKPRLRREQPG